MFIDMGNPKGKVYFDGYKYGMVLPDGYILVVILKPLFSFLFIH
jgi:hypothetical protein